MLRIRNIATTVALCALSIGAAAPAVAAPVLSGHYIKEETDASGRHATTNLYFTPCGDGCANEQDGGQAHLNNGQWVMDDTGNATCADGSTAVDVLKVHYVWDATTLQGTVQMTVTAPACGQSAGQQYTNALQLTQAS
jgi:hypothetical protein